MSVRIYALAKDLNVDSKELVEICRKAGITGKGSALASLSDDEVQKVKAFLSGDKKPSSKPAVDVEQTEARPQRLQRPEPSRPKPQRPQPLGSQPTGSQPTDPDTPYTRDAYIPPARGGSKIRVLDAGGKRPAAANQESPGDASPTDQSPAKPTPGSGKAPPKKRREPVIKLADIPQSKQPTPAPKADHVKAAKPDIRLPKDAIVRHKAGDGANLDALAQSAEKPRKTEDKDKRKPSKAKSGAGAGAGGAVETPLGSKATKRRKGGGAGPEEERKDRGLLGMAGSRAERQKARQRRGSARPGYGGDREAGTSRRPRTLQRRRSHTNTAAPRKEKATLEIPCTIRSFSEGTGVASGQILRMLMGMGVSSLSINAQLDEEMAEVLATELGVEIEFRQQASLEDTVLDELNQQEDAPESLSPRPPVVTFLGHVDHGKTSLLDGIIGTNVVAGEAGGITQHIRAYQISKEGRKIAFVDTPGHEAFTEMRARGANVTDIAVLVVAADDGVMPQTQEAISHAKAAGVPIIVALNKMDLPGANPDRVLQELAAQEILPSEWGGDVEVVRTSATTGEGIDNLLETILVTAELHEYQANADRKAVGVCLEAEQEQGRGVMAKLIVKNGTLRVGDILLCGSSYGRVKAMYDTLKPKKKVKAAGPSMPVNLSGFDEAPEAGQRFYVLDDITQARTIAEQRMNRDRRQSLAGGTTRVSFEEFQRRLAEGNLSEARDIVTLNLIVRADVRGSIEAIEKELSKLDHPEIQIRILHKAVGAITAADVVLAHASQAVIIGFNVIPDEAARAAADEKNVEIRRYDVIYKVTDDVRATLEGKLKPDEKVVELGHAIVKQVFPISRVGAVAGCYVVRGSIQRGCRIRVNRDGRTIGDYPLDSLRREKEDIKEVPRGMECGIKLSGFNDVKQDDILEAYLIEEVARTL